MLVNGQITKSNLEPCNHEEACARLFVHAQDAALTIMQKVIVLIALYIFCDLKWINLGSNMIVERIVSRCQYIIM